MAIIYPNAGGGGSVWSIDLTATASKVMANKTAITSDSNDASIYGTLPLTAVKVANGGTMQINGLATFSVSQSTTSPNTVIFTGTIVPQTGKPWTGYHVRCKQGGYPTSITDGTSCGSFTSLTGTYTFPATTENTTWWFRAWDYVQYNTNGSTTYDKTEWGTYHNATCSVERHPNPYVLTFAGRTDGAESSGSYTIPIGYTHANIAVIGPGGGAGSSFEYERFGYDSSGEDDIQYRHNGSSGGEGGQVITATLNMASKASFSYKIGRVGYGGYSDDYSNSTSSYDIWYTKSPYTTGTQGTSTTLTINGTTYTSQAGHCGTSASSNGAGGTGGPGADGGSAHGTWDSASSSYGDNGADGTYFSGTGLYYGGGGRGYASREERYNSHTDRDIEGRNGVAGAGQENYGGGANGCYGFGARGQAGAVIVVLT